MYKRQGQQVLEGLIVGGLGLDLPLQGGQLPLQGGDITVDGLELPLLLEGELELAGPVLRPGLLCLSPGLLPLDVYKRQHLDSSLTIIPRSSS